MNLEERILATLYAPMIFPQFQKELEKNGIQPYGDRAFVIEPKTIIWHGMSPQVAKGIQTLFVDEKITIELTPLIFYAAEGKILPYPLAGQVGCTTTWLPCLLRKT
ncbi:MAG: hypothetical protein WDZ51_03815 [Pirellulaceae bacterium]